MLGYHQQVFMYTLLVSGLLVMLLCAMESVLATRIKLDRYQKSAWAHYSYDVYYNLIWCNNEFRYVDKLLSVFLAGLTK